ncbi:MAG TPA: PIN domain-containing protein, partial [Spirochaetota bacterium]|nr:PIN domain-containing protein [Spirochaetota bacterium]
MLKDNSNKIFVLDTNVVLYDYRCIYSFEEHNVVIPITLLEEVDKFKRGNEIINYNAREFSRELDALVGDRLLKDGIPLDTGGFIMVETDLIKDDFLSEIFWEDNPDHRILSIAYNLALRFGWDRVILVSKDINLRMKAKGIGLKAEDYETGKIKNIDDLYTGKNLIEHVPDDIIDSIFKESSVSIDRYRPPTDPRPNEYFIFRNNGKSVLSVYCSETRSFRHVEKKRAYGVTPRNAEQTFSLDALTDMNRSLVTLAGKAGTGKTLLAMAAGLKRTVL